jgi:hypothetical protein
MSLFLTPVAEAAARTAAAAGSDKAAVHSSPAPAAAQRERGAAARRGSTSSSSSSASSSSSPARNSSSRKERAFRDKVRQGVKVALMPLYKGGGAGADSRSREERHLSHDDFKRLARRVTERIVAEHWPAARDGDGLYHRSVHGAAVKEMVKREAGGGGGGVPAPG